uniref:C2H2-type domain-containing protein n=3 Tax=Oryzias melastigma TaxID=30732 RepID=A0A3B3CAW8_ORYME
MNEVDYLRRRGAGSLPLQEQRGGPRLGVNPPPSAGAARPADVQPAMKIKEEVPWTASVGQQFPEPLHIKVEEGEEEELWSSPPAEPLHSELDYSRFPFTVVTVKSEEEEEEPHTSHFHQSRGVVCREAEPAAGSSLKWIKTECDGGDSGQLELVRNPNRLSTNTPTDSSEASEEEEDSDEGEWHRQMADARPAGEAGSGVRLPPQSGTNIPTAPKPFSCSECGKQFLYKQSLKRHMRRNTEKSPAGCTLGAKRPELRPSAEPPRVHTGKKKFACEDCGKTFRDHFSLRSHMRVHSEEKPFGCQSCGKSFKHEHNLKIHMRIHTGEEPFGCDVCGKRFKHQHNLKTHMRIHTGEKPFVCDICGKRARHQNNLKTHMIVHKGERPFGCDVCGKRFNRKTSLRAHTTVHTGEKPYGCDVCGKSYKRKTHLRTHMTVHAEEKPFGCEVCGKRFNRKTHLATHMAVHTGEKPYSCDFCGKRFTRKTHLNSHITVHTGEKPFGCGVCGQEFTQQGSLNRHMRFHLG